MTITSGEAGVPSPSSLVGPVGSFHKMMAIDSAHDLSVPAANLEQLSSSCVSISLSY
jgi:hypothetical protein